MRLSDYAAVRSELSQAYLKAHGGSNPAAMLDAIEFQSRRFAGGFVGEVWTRAQVIAEVLKAKWPKVTPELCAGRTVDEIVASL